MSIASRRSMNFAVRTLLGGALLTAASAHGQSIPIPFASIAAGGGTVCSSSIPVFAVSGTGKTYGDGCPSTQSTLSAPVAVATDSNGNVFIADQTDDLVRVIYSGGTALANAIIAANVQTTNLVPQKGYIYTIVGGVTTAATNNYCNEVSGASGTDHNLNGCPGAEGYVQPRGLGVDVDGNVFISDVGSASSMRVFYVGGTKAAALIQTENPSLKTAPVAGYTYKIAGGGATSYTGNGVLATSATMNTPRGITIDASENIYVADQLNNLIRRIDGTTGFITTVAGYCIANGTLCTVAAPAGDGNAATSSSVSLDSPYGEALDHYGNLFIAEGGSGTIGRVRVVYAGGTLPGITNPVVGNIYTYAGNLAGTTQALQTAFQYVYGVTVDNQGYLYITDYRSQSTGANRIWRVDPTNGNIVALAGNGITAPTAGNHCNGGTTGPIVADKYGDACPATQAYLNTPQESLGFDGHGGFYVADRSNNLVRLFSYNNSFPATAVGSTTTQPLAFLYAAGSLPVSETFSLAGTAAPDYSDAGGDTCALNASLTATTTCVNYVKFAPSFAGQRNGSITVASATTTIAAQSLNGVGVAPVLTIDPGTSTALGTGIQPVSVSVDANGNVNISDAKAKQVLRTTINGGTPTSYITGLGAPAETTTDAYGDVFVADTSNNVVVEKTAAGATATFGSGLSAPQGVAADLLGNLYVADTGNNRLVYITPADGNQVTVPLSGFTLSAPTFLTLDGSGNLYILDTNNTRIIELPLGATPVLFTLPSGITPVAFGFDAGGNAYIADKASSSVLFLPAGATSTSTYLSGLTTPAGVAVANTGSVFVADSSATSPTAVNRTLNTSTFPTTNVGLTSLPVTLTLGNAGNAVATLATPPFTESGSNASAFVASGTPTCTAGATLASAATCTQAFVFSPTATTASQSATAVFSTTTGQSATANFNATATNLILTTTTISPANASINYGQSQAYTVTFTPKSTGSSAPSGTIAFLVGGKQQSTLPVPSSAYTFSAAPTAGTYSVAANYSGDSLYASSNASTTLTVNKAVTTTTCSAAQTATGLTISATMTPQTSGPVTFTGNVLFYVDGTQVATVAVGTGKVSTTTLTTDGPHTYSVTYAGDANYATSSCTTQNITVARAATTTTLTSTPVSSNGIGGLMLSAKVSSSATGTPSGTVTFSNGSTTLGTVNLSTAVNGVVSFTTSTYTYANYSFTAAYSGDGLFQPSTVTITQQPDFVVISPSATLGVPQGGQAVASVTVAPINGYSGTLTAACSNLPANALCRFLPTPLTVTSTANSTLTVQVFAGVNTSLSSALPLLATSRATQMIALLLIASAGFALRRRKMLRIVAVLLLATVSLGLSGCGSTKTPANPGGTYSTPVGTYNVTLTVTDSNNVARTSILSIAVNTQ